MLVHTVVQITLDRAAVGIRGQDEPLSSCAQPLDLGPQSIELIAPRLDLPSLQFYRPPGPDCPRLSVTAAAGSSGPALPDGMAASCRIRLPPP